jgi:hypothetical protein
MHNLELSDILCTFIKYVPSHPSHHCVKQPMVAEGCGGGLEMWRVAATVLRNQSWIAGKGWSSVDG